MKYYKLSLIINLIVILLNAVDSVFNFINEHYKDGFDNIVLILWVSTATMWMWMYNKTLENSIKEDESDTNSNNVKISKDNPF